MHQVEVQLHVAGDILGLALLGLTLVLNEHVLPVPWDRLRVIQVDVVREDHDIFGVNTLLLFEICFQVGNSWIGNLINPFGCLRQNCQSVKTLNANCDLSRMGNGK